MVQPSFGTDLSSNPVFDSIDLGIDRLNRRLYAIMDEFVTFAPAERDAQPEIGYGVLLEDGGIRVSGDCCPYLDQDYDA